MGKYKLIPLILLIGLILLSKGAVAEEDRSAFAKASADRFTKAREFMVETQLKTRDITDQKVLYVMGKVPRHEFVLPRYINQAYADRALLIDEGQTISQPYIVALMTELLDVKKGEKVLEIGTGSGYQAAILAELTDKVYTVEIIQKLGERARKTLKDLGYKNVRVRIADGYYGWLTHAPYDAIIVTCAPDHIPQPLIAQLKDGGRLVIPVGPPGNYQTLWQIKRKGDQLFFNNITGVLFVPMLGK